MADYKDYFKQLNKNKQAPKNKKMSLHYKTNTVKDNSHTIRMLSMMTLVAFCLALYGLVYPEQLADLSKGIKIGFFSQSLAAEEAISSSDPNLKEEKKSPQTEESKKTEEPKKSEAVTEKQSHVEQLLDKEKELAEREKHVVELEEKLQQQKLELDEKIKQLEQARRDIASRLETRVAQDQENLGKLVELYSNMKPQNAALVISKLDEELAIGVLRKMKKQDAGAIMNFMDPQKTKVLSEKYSGY